ncbi:MAG: OadG family protein [Firmicutes bacterium]|nr:OadG family protein [Bacillota bacterium]MCL5040420.1 OadG family protein [Bacillota bacterium]
MSDNLSSALQLTIIDMTIVFVVLYGLALMIRLVKFLLDRFNRAKANTPVPAVPGIAPNPGQATEVDPQGEEAPALITPAESSSVPMSLPADTVAVIAAALAAYLGDEREHFLIRGIRPVAESQGAWTISGRLDLIRSRQGRSTYGHR